MSGILDPKSRIMDVLLTEEGRRQLANGSIRIEYASFSDSSTFYEMDILSGSSDPSNRLFFECSSSPYDQITFETDDGGLLNPLKNTDVIVSNGLILTGSGNFVTGTQFINSANVLLSSSLSAFKNNFLIGTIDSLFEYEQFGLGQKSIRFKITDKNPISSPGLYSSNVTIMESLFQDQRMAHLPNFQYLPPINKPRDSTSVDFSSKAFLDNHVLGNYPRIDHGKTKSEVESSIKEKIKNLEEKGNVQTVRFDPTSNTNNLHCQLFEMSDNQLKKLDIIDFGTVRMKDDGTVQRMYFAGKVFVDDYGNHTFVNLFTLYFE
jgi:hypothetical protein